MTAAFPIFVRLCVREFLNGPHQGTARSPEQNAHNQYVPRVRVGGIVIRPSQVGAPIAQRRRSVQQPMAGGNIRGEASPLVKLWP